ncbi:hypothetical protein [Paenibacillus sp. Leaf72]|uniref:hypothetical protein n=1 Tax=Paenibacillus sp. Leaf72 TaxID=1736234 RepID=UPI0006FD00BC|nr:hypothetical protein [Paenibacillus sp. Leaf72]KQO12416.1 hypothetical protein ASF12_30845 [Paenibacillus sp. Leaf72]
MKWKVVANGNSYLVCRKTWHSPLWMGIVKKDIRSITINNRSFSVEVFADCSTSQLAHKLLMLAERP